MRIISFAWTTPALLAHPDPLAKTCTRRDWATKTVQSMHEGDSCWAYDRNPRIGGKPVAIIRLTESPYVESTADAPDTDYEAEGFMWFDKPAHHQWRALVMGKIAKEMRLPTDFNNMYGLWHEWRRSDAMLTVVRFEVREVIVPLDRWLVERAPAVLGAAHEMGRHG